jgi:cell division protein ZapA (FtsZ GTPase activity inhibitor)
METLIPVNIVIGDRSYRIKVAPEDEEHVRRTVKIINEKVVEFKTNFAGKDMQDYVAMVLIWYATQVTSENKNSTTIEGGEIQSAEALKKLEQQIDQLLKSA